MVRKKIDNRIRVMIENGVALGHRSLFVIVGNKARDQVVLLHHMLSKAQVRSRPSVLWCYKSELGFSSHRKKRMRQIQKRMKRGGGDVNEDDPFELFVAATTIRYCYYAETHKILGNTYGMCVLQDFEALTPNLLARTVETVEGGGIVTILLRSMDSLRQLYTMTMDVHSRYRTEAHCDVVGRFNERFILSLASCRTCVVMDDQLNVLPMSSHVLNVEAVPARSKVGCTRTLDQAKALLKFVEAISEKTLRSTVVMTAARGRGKSAALGLAMASAVAFGYSNIFVTSPSPENLKTLFEFVFKGFDALEYQEHLDYDVVQSTNPEFNKAIVRVNIYREHRQTIQYIHPADAHRLGQAELVCIDEAAAIPLPMVKALLGPYLVFMSSTINGYEGTGRSLSLKLVQQLREQTAVLSSVSAAAAKTQTIESTVSMTTGKETSYRNRVSLQFNAHTYYVSRDTLFSYHSASEAFLQRLMSIYVSSHYKNTPNDLQMLSDAPAHHLFCMLGPVDSTQNSLPEVLCVLQVSLEGEILKASVIENSARGKRAAGDLIPWTISQQFQDPEFPGLAGGRVVRIATHPDYQGMGYGSRALQLLQKYYEGKFPSLDDPPKETADTVGSEVSNLLEEKLGPRKNLPPLLLKLSERPAERLDYLGVSYGLTSSLLRAFSLTYQKHNIELLGIELHSFFNVLYPSFVDFQRRFLSLLAYQFSKFTPSLALNILPQRQKNTSQELRRADVERDFGDYDLRRLETYARNMADHHVITDLLPAVARLYFLGRLDVSLSIVQQHKFISLSR
ncbi:PREDICTED: N-acetyltransferase 10-like [Priapulus caudatus]|uniref:RNA cytidine acetyltransferase n=1 Tax=Priapulus caudatus TaxID=37621 RepID=A0ABM1EPZ0_PRICU|nr:PREDICTED: N-acetyltransferase 10-like [Priapulus caudatus]